jgi:hypothetical protein
MRSARIHRLFPLRQLGGHAVPHNKHFKPVTHKDEYKAKKIRKFTQHIFLITLITTRIAKIGTHDVNKSHSTIGIEIETSASTRYHLLITTL